MAARAASAYTRNIGCLITVSPEHLHARGVVEVGQRLGAEEPDLRVGALQARP